MTLRASVVADVPSPHQNVFFDAVARLGEVDLEVLFCRRTMPGRAWSGEGPQLARHRFLRRAQVGQVPTNPTLIPELLAARGRTPLLIGYYLPAMLGAGLALGALRRTWIFWTDTLPAASTRDPLPRKLARRFFLDRATLCLTTGEAGRAALLGHGVAAERTAVLPFVVDHGFIQREVGRQDRDAIRAALGLGPETRAFLFVGQMIRRKGIDVLLDALALLLPPRGPLPTLLLLGEGAERAAFEAQAARLGLARHVRFLPYVDNAQLPRFWAAADAFVLPSRFDAWPVVVVEALAAGLPVLGTDACGSVRDLVTPANGFVARAGDAASLATALAAASTVDLRPLAAAARESVRHLAPDAVARDFTSVLEQAARLAAS